MQVDSNQPHDVMKTIKISIAGAGNIGRALLDAICEQTDAFEQKHGVRLRVTGVCNSRGGLLDTAGLSPKKIAQQSAYTPGLAGRNFVQQVDADILVEAGPSDYVTGEPGLSYADAAIARGLHVIFISKGAMLLHGTQLLEKARKQGVAIKYRCATASGLPAIDLLESAFANATIEKIEGVLTGTTSFILDKMQSQGCSLTEALTEARALGMTEPDPTNDLNGKDTACKLLIIANTVFRTQLTLADMSVSGIESVSPEDIATACAEGKTPRLIGSVARTTSGINAAVQLQYLNNTDTLARLNARDKALRIFTREFGETILAGGSSSRDATIAAAMEDLAQIVRL